MSQDHETKAIDILLVEDSKSDAYLTTETLSESNIFHQLYRVKDGVEALDFLYKQGKYTNVPRPDLILLDLNLPRKNGKEVLAEVKANESLRTIPVVVLTTSNDEEDIARIYQLQASCYLVKPVELDQFTAVVRSIENFWLTRVTYPPGLE